MPFGIIQKLAKRRRLRKERKRIEKERQEAEKQNQLDRETLSVAKEAERIILNVCRNDIELRTFIARLIRNQTCIREYKSAYKNGTTKIPVKIPSGTTKISEPEETQVAYAIVRIVEIKKLRERPDDLFIIGLEVLCKEIIGRGSDDPDWNNISIVYGLVRSDHGIDRFYPAHFGSREAKDMLRRLSSPKVFISLFEQEHDEST